jgi:hypothetical protein
MSRPIFCVLLHVSVACCGQAFENIRAEISGDKILIRYDLTGPASGFGVDVRAYSSADGFRDVLTNVTGDLIKVRPGPGRSILWKPPANLDNFNGQLSFELRGDIVKDLSFVGLSRKLKRGKPTTVQWQGGRATDNIRIEFQSSGGIPVWSSTVRNDHRIEWVPPAKTKTGPGYTYKLTTADGTVVSSEIKVKPKVSRAWFLIPPLLAAGAYMYLIYDWPLPEAPPPPPTAD